LKSFARFIRKHPHRFRDFQLLALPIGPVLGDHPAILEEDLPQIVRLSTWPHPLLLAELIGNAEAVVGHSYHLAVTALAFGVPAFCSADLSFWKYTALSDFETLYAISPGAEIDPQWFAERLGKRCPSPKAYAALDRLAQHWDRVAETIREGSVAVQPALDRFWQSLPILLETREELFAARTELAALRRSPSMRVTAPLRFLMRNLKRLVGR